MKNRKYTFVLLFIFTSLATYAQEFPSELWHDGQVTLISGETIKGKIKYDLVNNLIQVNVGNALQTYSARKILNFDLFDETIKGHRHFYALPFNVQSDYKVPIIFEVLYEGPLTLLCREEIIQESATQFNSYPYYYNNYPYNSATQQRLIYKYYFLDKNGDIEYYNLKRKSLFDIFQRKSQEMKQYIKKNHLKHDKISDLVRMTAYYNALLEG